MPLVNPADTLESASNIAFTPHGNISSTNVQAALQEEVDDLAASSGSSLVGYVSSGTGATSRTVQAKEREWLSVTDFGATGDGTTNDTTALTNAFTAGTGRTVFVPNGTYKITSVIDVLSNTVVVFESWNAIIQYDLTVSQISDILRVNARTNVRISNGQLKGLNADGTVGNAAMAVRGASSFVWIAGMKIDGHNSGITVEDPSTDCWVEDNYVTGQLRHNVRQIGKARCHWRGNKLIGSTLENVVFNAPDNGSVTDIWFDHNYLEQANAKVFFQWSASTNPTYTRFSVCDNTFNDTASASDAIYTNSIACTNSHFDRNTFINGRVAMEMYAITGSTFNGNQISGCEEAGILLFGCTGNVVSGNVIKNCDSISATGSKGAICLRDNSGTGSTGNVITGNRCFDDQGPKTQQYGLNLSGTNSKTNIVIGNDFSGNLTAAVTGQTTATIVRQNAGFVTETKGTGTIASGTTLIAITHGLSVTPAAKDISLTMTNSPTADPGFLYADTFGSSQFTVRCKTDPGVSTLTFEWQATVL